MVREATGLFRKESNSNAGRIRVPAKLCLDSSFPFKDGQEVTIRIYTPPEGSPMGKTLIVEARSSLDITENFIKRAKELS